MYPTFYRRNISLKPMQPNFSYAPTILSFLLYLYAIVMTYLGTVCVIVVWAIS